MSAERDPRPTASNRGESARAALLEAAIEEFSEHGPDGTRTRAIAQRAGQNLATLHYHFSSKDKLYHALAEHLVAQFRPRLSARVAEMRQTLADPAFDSFQAADRLRQLLLALFDIIVADESTVPMSRILVREQMRPTAVFDIFYTGVLEPMHTTLTALLARVLDRPADDAQLIAQAHALIGQVFGFRAARATVLRRTGWTHIDEAEAAILRTAIETNLEALFTGFLQTETNHQES